MRFLAIGIVSLLAVAPASAQSSAAGHPYGLDPYAPSDAMWLRAYGAALVAQTPMLELATLDPYKPSEAALIRQVGGAMPLCCLNSYWPSLMPGSTPPSLRAVANAPVLRFAPTSDAAFIVSAAPASAAVAGAPPATSPSSPGPTSATTLARPATNDGVSIRYFGQTWTSAGRAMPRVESAFERVGDMSGFPVYKRTGANDDLIYVSAGGNLVAPYRLKR